MIEPLVERLRVRRAAVALCKALMRETGLRVRDLDAPPSADPAPEQAGGAALPLSRRRDQLVTPADKPARVHKPPAWGASPAALIPSVVAPKIALPKTGEVVIPPGVKFTQCPSGRDTRFTVEGPVFGEFTRDWQARRSAKPARKR